MLCQYSVCTSFVPIQSNLYLYVPQILHQGCLAHGPWSCFVWLARSFCEISFLMERLTIWWQITTQSKPNLLLLSFRKISSDLQRNCNYIHFIPQVALARRQRRDLSIFKSSWHLPTCLPNTLIAQRQAGKLRIPIFIVFGLTRPEIEPESTAPVADALSIRPLIGNFLIITGENFSFFGLHLLLRTDSRNTGWNQHQFAAKTFSGGLQLLLGSYFPNTGWSEHQLYRTNLQFIWSLILVKTHRTRHRRSQKWKKGGD